MHEYGIVKSIISCVMEETEKRQIKSPVKKITVDIGAIHGLIPESCDLFFEELKSGVTGLENATLNIELHHLKVFCPKCEKEETIEEALLICPECGVIRDIKEGEELNVKTVEFYD